MRYFFLAYALLAILVVAIGGFRGDKFSQTPIEIFPDMDRQDVVKAQTPNDFFHDGLGARQPVTGTQPHGFSLTGDDSLEFGGDTSYFATGHINEFYGNGMPKELKLDKENTLAFLRHGEQKYQINCAICHGSAGNGAGMAAQYGVPGVANLRAENYFQSTYPDGRLYNVITNGYGQMKGYKHNLTLRDRWAIVAYVRAIQFGSKAPKSEALVKKAFESATADSQ